MVGCLFAPHSVYVTPCCRTSKFPNNLHPIPRSAAYTPDETLIGFATRECRCRAPQYLGTISKEAPMFEKLVLRTKAVARKLVASWRRMAGCAALAASLVSLPLAAPTPPDICGNWQGTLKENNGARIVLQISQEDGRLKAVWSNIDRGGEPVPATSIALQGQVLSFSIGALNIAYVGTLRPDGLSISGEQTQDGQTQALNLERASAEN